jgi:hypothetical protein
MSFRIFAAGSEDFHFIKDDNIDQDSFDTIKTLAILQNMEPTKMGAVGAVAEKVLPSAGITDLMNSMAAMEFLHNLDNAVSFLAMCSGSSDGWISVSSTKRNYIFPNTSGFFRYNFLPGDSPGSEFIRGITPGLKNTEMNTWGVLFVLANVLSKFYNHIGDSGRPIINIQLSK